MFITRLIIAAILIFSLIAGIQAGENKNIILATTTSLQDTGLLDVLTAAFRKKIGYIVKAVAVGTGQAIQMGRFGEADILWVHSPVDEKQFVDAGYGINRTTFIHNDFVVLGPKSDPAKVSGVKSASEAFKKITEAKALFISRGDNSGTHKKEKEIWKETGLLPDKEAYIEAGQGMAKTAGIAYEKQGYILADRATYLSLKNLVDLVIVCENDPALVNYYSLILVNPDKFPKVNKQGARRLFDFLLSDESREIIESFGREQFGQQLFFWDLE